MSWHLLLLVDLILLDERLVELLVNAVSCLFGGAIEAEVADDKAEDTETDDKTNHDGHDVRSILNCGGSVYIVIIHVVLAVSEAGLGFHRVVERGVIPDVNGCFNDGILIL